VSEIDTIIDLIFDNVYIAAIVLFFLFKLFTGSSGKSKPTGMPTFGGEPHQSPQQWQDKEDDEEDSSGYKQFEQEQQRRQQELERQRQLEELKRQREQELAAERRKEELAARMQRTASELSNLEGIKRKRALAELMKAQQAQQSSVMKREPISALKTKEVKRTDLQNAVIWSEILGPPRAKRHYRR